MTGRQVRWDILGVRGAEFDNPSFETERELPSVFGCRRPVRWQLRFRLADGGIEGPWIDLCLEILSLSGCPTGVVGVKMDIWKMPVCGTGSIYLNV